MESRSRLEDLIDSELDRGSELDNSKEASLQGWKFAMPTRACNMNPLRWVGSRLRERSRSGGNVVTAVPPEVVANAGFHFPCKMKKWAVVILRAMRIGLVCLRDLSQVKCINGPFFLKKPDGELRWLLDRRRCNVQLHQRCWPRSRSCRNTPVDDQSE